MARPPTSTDFLESHRAYRGFAGRVRRVHGAQVLTNPRYPHLPRANCILVGALEPPVDLPTIFEESEPLLRASGVAVRRVMLFGEETSDRLGGPLLLDGFVPQRLPLMSFSDGVPVRATPPGRVVWVDPFRMPGRYALRYRIAAETQPTPGEAAESARLYLSRADAAWRRTAGAYVDGQLASAAELVRVGSLAEVAYVETAPEFRGRGLARDVVSFLVAAAFDDGARGVYLVTDEGPFPAAFYQRLGFEMTAVLTSFQRGVMQVQS